MIFYNGTEKGSSSHIGRSQSEALADLYPLRRFCGGGYGDPAESRSPHGGPFRVRGCR